MFFVSKKIKRIKSIVNELDENITESQNPEAYRVVKLAKYDLDHSKQAAPMVALFLANSFYDQALHDKLDLPENLRNKISELKTLCTANGFGMTMFNINVNSKY